MKTQSEKIERLTGESFEWFSVALESLHEKTREQYLSKFTEFLTWAETDTEALLKEHEANLKDDDKRKRKLIPKKVYDFQKYRVEVLGDKVASSRLIVKVAKKFFSANETDFSMNSFKIRVENEAQALRQIPIISKPQLKTMLEVCGSLRMRSIIHTAKDTGLRISDVCSITMKHIQPVLDNSDLEFHTFEILPQKNLRQDQPLRANPVLGPDANNAIRNWIRRRGEMGIDSPFLYTSVKNVKAHTTTTGQTNKATVRGEPLNPSNAGVIFRQLRNKAGLKESKISIHSLRKFHKTYLEYAGCPTSWINRMQGRKGQGTGGTYTKPNPDQLMEIYSKAYTSLSLDTTDTHTQNTRIDEMQEDLNQLMDVLTITQGMVMETRGLTDRNQLIAEFNKYVKALKDNNP